MTDLRGEYYTIQLAIWLASGLSLDAAKAMAEWHVRAAFGGLMSDQVEYQKDWDEDKDGVYR